MTVSRNKDTASARRATTLDALNASYTPGDAKDWPNGDPGTVADAFDEIRAAMRRFFQGTFIEPFDARATSDGATVTMEIEQTGGGDLTMVFNEGHSQLDCTPLGTASITLTPGASDAAPAENFVHIPESTGVLTVTTDDWPAEHHIRVAYCLVPTAALVQSGAAGNNFLYINQNWNDERFDGAGQGHLTHIAEKLRHLGAVWHSGCEGVATQDGNDLWVSVASGEVEQMHHHDFAALDSDTAGAGDSILVANDPDAAYTAINSLNEITKHSDGSAIGTNKYVKFILWCVINKGGEISPMMVNVPSDEYNSATGAAIDVNGYANFTFQREFNLESSTGFLVSAFVCKHTATAMEIEITIDLRGQVPGTAVGAGTGGGDVTSATTIADNAVVRGDGGAKGVQGSGVLVDDGDSITGIDDLTAVGLIATSAVTAPLLQATVPITVKSLGDITLDAFQNGVDHEVHVKNTGAGDVIAGFNVEGTARFETEVANTSAAAVTTIDWTQGNKQKLDLDEDITTVNFTDPAGPCSLILRVIQDGTGGWTVAGADWDNILWQRGIVPVISPGIAAVDIVALYYKGSGIYYGVASLDFS